MFIVSAMFSSVYELFLKNLKMLVYCFNVLKFIKIKNEYTIMTDLQEYNSDIFKGTDPTSLLLTLAFYDR